MGFLCIYPILVLRSPLGGGNGTVDASDRGQRLGIVLVVCECAIHHQGCYYVVMFRSFNENLDNQLNYLTTLFKNIHLTELEFIDVHLE